MQQSHSTAQKENNLHTTPGCSYKKQNSKERKNTARETITSTLPVRGKKKKKHVTLNSKKTNSPDAETATTQ